MTFISNQQIGRREDLSDAIYNIAPTETPFLSSAKKGAAAKNTRVEWQTDTFRAAAINDNIEGSDVIFNTRQPTARLAGFCQLFDEGISVSDIASDVTTAGRKKELSYQIAKASAQIKRDIEFVLTGNFASRDGGANTSRRLASVEAWLTTNVGRGTGGSNGGWTGTVTNAATDASATNLRTFTEARLQAVVRACWDAGGQPDTVIVGSRNKQRASAFAGIATRQQQYSSGASNPGTLSIIGAADIYVSDFGALKITPSRFSRARSALVLDMDYWSVHYLQPFEILDLARTGHAEKKAVRATLTLASRNEAASGIVADLTST